jgi:hypothetical protein
MQENCRRAAEFAQRVRELFPMLDLYVPGENDEFVQKAYRMGVLTEGEILAVDFELIRDRDFLMVYAPDLYESSGMREEIAFADSIRKPVCYCVTLDDCTVAFIRQFVVNLGRDGV